MAGIVERMTGEELLVMRVFGDRRIVKAVNSELNRRARFGPAERTKTEQYWAGRTFANRHSARLAA